MSIKTKIYMHNAKSLEKRDFKAIQEQFPDSEAIFNKAVEIMVLKAGRCICDVPINTFYIRVDPYKLRCKRCRIVISPLSVTPFRKRHKQLTETLDVACRFFQARSVIPTSKISGIYKCRYETARTTTKRVVEWMKLALGESQGGIPIKGIADNSVVRLFAKQHDNLTSAVSHLFNALPTMRLAMVNDSKFNNQKKQTCKLSQLTHR